MTSSSIPSAWSAFRCSCVGGGLWFAMTLPNGGEATRWQEGLAESEANKYKEFANFRLLHLLLAAFPTTGAAIP